MKIDKTLEDLEDLVVTELNKITKKGELTPAELKNATDAVCLLEKITNIQNGSNSYSERSFSYPNTRMTRNSYSRNYSGHSIQDRMIDRLEHMMDEATSQYEKDAIAEWIEKLRM